MPRTLTAVPVSAIHATAPPMIPALGVDAPPRQPRCACGRLADSLHVLPDLVRAARVALCCSRHDAGGRWWFIREYFDGPPGFRDPSRRYTARDHIATKIDGLRLVKMIDHVLGVDDAAEM